MKTTRRISGADFRSLRPARRINGALFSLSITPISQPSPKYACVVSKKVSTKAVDRNLIKRRCRSVLQSELKHSVEPVALVLQAKRAAAQASFADIKHEIKTLLSRPR